DVVQSNAQGVPGGLFSTPTFFNNRLYVQGVNGVMHAFDYENGMLSTTPSVQATKPFKSLGATATVSADGLDNAVLWAIEVGIAESNKRVELHAYDPSDLTEIYNSDMVDKRDQ